MSKHIPMPEHDSEAILASLEAFKARDPEYKDGKVWSLVYYLDEQHSSFLKESYHRYACEARTKSAG
jgi:hypothetical protein